MRSEKLPARLSDSKDNLDNHNGYSGTRGWEKEKKCADNVLHKPLEWAILPEFLNGEYRTRTVRPGARTFEFESFYSLHYLFTASGMGG